MGFSLKKAFSSLFNDDTAVRAGLVAGAAVLAFGVPVANMLHDQPSNEVSSPTAAYTQRQLLDRKFEALKEMEQTFRADLQDKALNGGTIAQQDVSKLADSHVAFMKTVMFSKNISEQDYGRIRGDYVKNFADTYGYTFKYTVNDKHGERVEARKLSFDSMDDVASFTECQNKYITPENLSDSTGMMKAVGNCLYAPNKMNIFHGMALGGVALLSILAGFNTVTLRDTGQRMKDNIEAQERRAAEEARKEAARVKAERMSL